VIGHPRPAAKRARTRTTHRAPAPTMNRHAQRHQRQQPLPARRLHSASRRRHSACSTSCGVAAHVLLVEPLPSRHLRIEPDQRSVVADETAGVGRAQQAGRNRPTRSLRPVARRELDRVADAFDRHAARFPRQPEPRTDRNGCSRFAAAAPPRCPARAISRNSPASAAWCSWRARKAAAQAGSRYPASDTLSPSLRSMRTASHRLSETGSRRA
jgi:hypothetical protein